VRRLPLETRRGWDDVVLCERASIACASLPAEHAVPGTPVEVEIFGDWVAGEIATEPLFDSRGGRLRA